MRVFQNLFGGRFVEAFNVARTLQALEEALENQLSPQFNTSIFATAASALPVNPENRGLLELNTR